MVCNSMFSAKDAEELSIPVGLFVSGDEPRDEVCRLYSDVTSWLICFRSSQFDKFVDVLSKKPFAAKVDSKYYGNMFVVCLVVASETHHLLPGSTAGLLPVQISRIPTTRENTRTSTPGLLLSLRMCSLKPSPNTKTKRCPS